jgi:RNA polymerase sigma-70 factor (ECF subfamily)
LDATQRKQIEKLYIQMFDRLLVYARSTLSDEALAEEAVQETFRVACQKPEELCDSANPQGWLVLTLRNAVRHTKDRLTTIQKNTDCSLSSDSQENVTYEDRIQLEVLYEDIADTEAFKLLSEMAIEGKSYQEMAQARGISVSTCRKRVQRAKETLQKKLE